MDKEGYKKLGTRAFYFFTLERSVPALCLFILECVFIVIQAFGGFEFLTNIFGQDTASLVLDYAVSIVLALFLFACVFALLSAYAAYSAFRYKVDENGFAIEQGIFSKDEISLPFKQIQNIDVEQSILYRIFGMSNLVILTAGHEDKGFDTREESEIVIPAMTFADAKELQKFLLEKANIDEVRPILSTPPSSPKIS
ncbi:MAG: PH domain-containing protein [Candidatus Pacebacteria bacterium]|nr:PH domain-containing protein [Candidatus Paceibacterota bacterium]